MLKIMLRNHNYQIFRINTCIYFLFVFFSLAAEPDPVKFGNIDKSSLEMKVYDKDTTADAIVLCDFGDFDAHTFKFKRIYRVKVLKKSGCDRANFVISTYTKSNFKGLTYNLVNGEIEKTKLKDESIFEEDMDNEYFRYKVAMPNVRVGSVIEIQVSFYGIPSSWHFQSNIPVVWSELRLISPSEVEIQKILFGFQPFSIAEEGRWVCKDVPALKIEPYINNLDNFLTKFEFEYSLFWEKDRISSNWNAVGTSNWNDVNNYLLNKSPLSRALETMFFMGDEAKAINENCKSQKEKAFAAYETIKKKIKWNDEEYPYPHNNSSISNALKKGTGNAGEVNTALLLLLKKLDIEAYPIALSTRNNGMLSVSLPILKKINYLIVLAKIDGKDLLLDATDEFLPAGFLPQRCINGNGRLVKANASVWVELKPGGIDKIKQFSNLNISAEGEINGSTQCLQSEYAAYLFRKKYADYNDKNDYTKEQERTIPGLIIKSSSVEAIDSIYNPITINQLVNYNANIDVSDSIISFNPIIFDRLATSPFNLDERKMPIDYINPFEHVYYYNYKIPSGYKVQNIPNAINLTLPDKKGKFIYKSSASDTLVQITCNFSISNSIFTQDEYSYIKQLYAEILKKESEPVILKRK